MSVIPLLSIRVSSVDREIRKMPIKLLIALTTAVAIFVPHTAARAMTFTESGDAGETLATAQAVGSGTTLINGNLATGTADLFSFLWNGGDFTAQTTGPSFDTQLFIFDASGFGVVADDDSGSGLLSALTTPLASGLYYLGISEFDYDPISAGGRIFDTSFGTSGPTGPGGASPLAGWDQFAIDGGGSYNIEISATAAVPTPALLPGLIGLAIGAVRKREA